MSKTECVRTRVGGHNNKIPDPMEFKMLLVGWIYGVTIDNS